MRTAKIVLMAIVPWAAFAWLIWLESGSAIASLVCFIGAMESVRADLMHDLWKMSDRRTRSKTPGAGQP